MNSKTCFFTGHRKLPPKKINRIIKRLNDEVENLIHQGVTTFISSGEPGFDQLAASLIIAKKEMGANIRLIFVLCRNQDEHWTTDQKRLYHSLLPEADEVHYISNDYSDEGIKQRNHYMADNSSHCICALLQYASTTTQAVRYAQTQGLDVINVAK